MKHGSIGGLTLLGTFGLRVRVHLIERCVFVCVCVCVAFKVIIARSINDQYLI